MPVSPQMPAEHSTIETFIHDVDGNVVARFTVDSWEYLETDGTWRTLKRSSNLQLADFSVFNPSMMAGDARVMLTTCEVCRHPPLRMFRREKPNHGLIMQHNAVVCADCRGTFCPRHTVHGSYGKRVCASCRRKQSVLRVIKSVFFTRSP